MGHDQHSAQERVLTVENTGEKLSPQSVAMLAEPFLRGTKRIRTDHPGVGLGLAIVKSITQAHDGRSASPPSGPPADSAPRFGCPWTVRAHRQSPLGRTSCPQAVRTTAILRALRARWRAHQALASAC